MSKNLKIILIMGFSLIVASSAVIFVTKSIKSPLPAFVTWAPIMFITCILIVMTFLTIKYPEVLEKFARMFGWSAFIDKYKKKEEEKIKRKEEEK